ncbi:DUF779 domain-containing protein [Xylophilus rhododendri]|uniref:DUF779 domain-containing protein n=1 Tax=Xylophilus rhododendri TaxID=2697032 RepID=A0A857J2X3_9BURK|nr:DUF779 domain-containing protein [Xylophilus rhododendri]QHI98284.1 DUF779 domain-containing protein [Xylophilus rhododendri]
MNIAPSSPSVHHPRRSSAARLLPWSERILATANARALIARLHAEHGPLMFHQAGAGAGAEPSLPLCFVQGDFPLVEMDVLLGDIGGTPFYVSHGQYRALEHSQLRLDATEGLAGVFSLERSTGMRFSTTVRPLLRPVARRTAATSAARPDMRG